MIVVLGLPLNVATIILSCIFSMLFCNFRAHGPISITTPPIAALIEFFYLDAEINVHSLPVSCYFISSLWRYLCSCRHTITMLWSIAVTVISGSWPILFKVLFKVRRNRSTTSQILIICRILEGVRVKNLEATLLFVDFSKAFDFIYRGKMEQILFAYDHPKETVTNTKVKVRSPDGDSDYFDIVAGVLQRDTFAPWTGDHGDDRALLANSPTQAETLLHSLERAADKAEYMCFN